MPVFRRRGAIAAAVAIGALLALGATQVVAASHHQTNRRTAVGSHPAAVTAPAAKVVHHYSLAASAFAPDSIQTPANDYYNGWDPSTLTNHDNNRCFDAGLSVPGGAALVSVTFYYTKDSTDAIYLEINRQNLKTHTDKVLATFTSKTTGSTGYKSVTLPLAGTVAYGSNAYSAGVCPFGNATFTGLTINYTG
jgi:hypothetical protein